MNAPVTFLILDDDANNRFLAGHALQREFPGCNLVESHSVDSALQVAKTQRFDGIVTDHHLGDGTGAEFVQQLRASGITCPVVMVTASSDPAVINRALTAGATRVFSGLDFEFARYFRAVVSTRG